MYTSECMNTNCVQRNIIKLQHIPARVSIDECGKYIITEHFLSMHGSQCPYDCM